MVVLFKLGTNEFGFVAGDNDGPAFDDMPPTFATNNGGSGNRIDFWEIHSRLRHPHRFHHQRSGEDPGPAL